MNIEELYTNLETVLIKNIAKKIGQNKRLYNQVEKSPEKVLDWQLDRLNKIDGLTEENIKIIARETKKTPEEIGRLFEEVLDELPDEKLIGRGIKANVLSPVAPIKESQTIKNALTVAKNSTRTTFNAVNNSLLASSRQVYIDTVNKVSTNVIGGVMTPIQAMASAVREMSQEGLTAFTASNGAKWSPEAYTGMVVRTNVKNTINDLQDIRIREAGGNYIEINSYVGARPLCSQDQGQIFSLNGDTTPITDINDNVIQVRAWSSSTNGEPAGILGINCGHQKFMFVPELSSYDREPINKKENDAEYEERQQQRYLERQIRYAKREQIALESARTNKEYIRKANAKVRQKQKDMREFIDRTNKNRNYAREQVIE